MSGVLPFQKSHGPRSGARYGRSVALCQVSITIVLRGERLV